MRAEAELGPRAESSPITQSSRDRTWRPHHGAAGRGHCRWHEYDLPRRGQEYIMDAPIVVQCVVAFHGS
jgi:hypothetical protein